MGRVEDVGSDEQEVVDEFLDKWEIDDGQEFSPDQVPIILDIILDSLVEGNEVEAAATFDETILDMPPERAIDLLLALEEQHGVNPLCLAAFLFQSQDVIKLLPEMLRRQPSTKWRVLYAKFLESCEDAKFDQSIANFFENPDTHELKSLLESVRSKEVAPENPVVLLYNWNEYWIRRVRWYLNRKQKDFKRAFDELENAIKGACLFKSLQDLREGDYRRVLRISDGSARVLTDELFLAMQEGKLVKEVSDPKENFNLSYEERKIKDPTTGRWVNLPGLHLIELAFLNSIGQSKRYHPSARRLIAIASYFSALKNGKRQKQRKLKPTPKSKRS